jgi:hypothetical protein
MAAHLAGSGEGFALRHSALQDLIKGVLVRKVPVERGAGDARPLGDGARARSASAPTGARSRLARAASLSSHVASCTRCGMPVPSRRG